MKILCLGDSNTFGYDPRSFIGSQYPPHHRWVDVLAQKRNCNVINAGENGRKIPSSSVEWNRIQCMLESQNNLDLLIVMLGSNDLLEGNSPEVIAKRMGIFLENIHLKKEKILLISPPPMQRGEWVTTDILVDASVSLGKYYKVLSNQLGIHFVDAAEWNITLSFDGVHFTENGHAAFAEGLNNYLNKGERLCLKLV